MDVIEEHYRENYRKLCKRMTFRAGTEWDGEDIVQEAYARAILYFPKANVRVFGAWFTTVLNNTLREYKNTSKGFSNHPTFEEDEHEGTPCNHYTSRVSAEIDELIQTKSLVQIEVLGLYFQGEFTAIDISRMTEHGYKTTHQMISRFKKELQELYGKE